MMLFVQRLRILISIIFVELSWNTLKYGSDCCFKCLTFRQMFLSDKKFVWIKQLKPRQLVFVSRGGKKEIRIWGKKTKMKTNAYFVLLFLSNKSLIL